MEMTLVRHRLTDKDPATRTATCSICGPVRMAKNGDYWMCSVKKADLRASWFNRNKRVAKPSPHALLEKDPQTRLGVCPIDGPVDIVPYARGWACAVRARELGQMTQREPLQKCSVCGNFDSRHNPVSPTANQPMCEACERLMYQGTEPRTNVDDHRLIIQTFESSGGGSTEGAHQHDGALGAHIMSNFEWLNPEYMPDYESAVPGWKTLGAKP